MGEILDTALMLLAMGKHMTNPHSSRVCCGIWQMCRQSTLVAINGLCHKTMPPGYFIPRHADIELWDVGQLLH